MSGGAYSHAWLGIEMEQPRSSNHEVAGCSQMRPSLIHVFSLATKEIRVNYDEIIMAILSVRPTQLIALARHDLNKNQQNLTS